MAAKITITTGREKAYGLKIQTSAVDPEELPLGLRRVTFEGDNVCVCFDDEVDPYLTIYDKKGRRVATVPNFAAGKIIYLDRGSGVRARVINRSVEGTGITGVRVSNLLPRRKRQSVG